MRLVSLFITIDWNGGEMKWKMAQAFAGLAETILYLKVFSNLSVLLTYTQLLFTLDRDSSRVHMF